MKRRELAMWIGWILMIVILLAVITPSSTEKPAWQANAQPKQMAVEAVASSEEAQAVAGFVVKIPASYEAVEWFAEDGKIEVELRDAEKRHVCLTVTQGQERELMRDGWQNASHFTAHNIEVQAVWTQGQGGQAQWWIEGTPGTWYQLEFFESVSSVQIVQCANELIAAQKTE